MTEGNGCISGIYLCLSFPSLYIKINKTLIFFYHQLKQTYTHSLNKISQKYLDQRNLKRNFNKTPKSNFV